MAKKIVYEMYPIAWPGGLKQMTEHLPRVKALEADYVWLAPIYPSPRCDHGYDIADYCAVDTRFGTLEDLSQFINCAHRLGIKVMLDMVLNHTSTEHTWFHDKHQQRFYCLETSFDHPGWENLFAPGTVPLKWRPDIGKYYLHLFHDEQADLNWYPQGKLNYELVEEFRDIVCYWLRQGVDGFRLDAVQALNKDLAAETMNLETLMVGDRAIEIINAVFDGAKTRDHEKPFLIAEIFDPSFGEIVDDFHKNSVVDYCLNMLIKQQASNGADAFLNTVLESVKHAGLMLDLENHDAPRFLSRVADKMGDGVAAEMLEETALFETGAQAICLYQGQEIGAENPNEFQLTDKEMLALDTQTRMRWQDGESLASLRPASRANARIPLSLGEYERQEKNENSFLNLFRRLVQMWKQS